MSLMAVEIAAQYRSSEEDVAPPASPVSGWLCILHGTAASLYVSVSSIAGRDCCILQGTAQLHSSVAIKYMAASQ